MSLPIIIALLISVCLFVGYLYIFLSPIIRDPSIVAPYSTQKALRHTKRTGYARSQTPSSSRSDIESAAGHVYSDDSQHSTTSQTHSSSSTTRLHPPHPFRPHQHHLSSHNGTAAIHPAAGAVGARGIRAPPRGSRLTRAFSPSPVAVRITTSNSSSTNSGSLISPPPPAYVSHPNTPTVPEYERGGWSSPTSGASSPRLGPGAGGIGVRSPPSADPHYPQYSSGDLRNVTAPPLSPLPHHSPTTPTRSITLPLLPSARGTRRQTPSPPLPPSPLSMAYSFPEVPRDQSQSMSRRVVVPPLPAPVPAPTSPRAGSTVSRLTVPIPTGYGRTFTTPRGAASGEDERPPSMASEGSCYSTTTITSPSTTASSLPPHPTPSPGFAPHTPTRNAIPITKVDINTTPTQTCTRAQEGLSASASFPPFHHHHDDSSICSSTSTPPYTYGYGSSAIPSSMSSIPFVTALAPQPHSTAPILKSIVASHMYPRPSFSASARTPGNFARGVGKHGGEPGRHCSPSSPSTSTRV